MSKNINAIEIKNLKKHFSTPLRKGSVKAVDNITFDVKRGECFGFLGPNGAGKTTTIRCLMGFAKPTSGEIKIFGRDIASDIKALKSDIGYLSGNVRLYNEWTGWEHIKYIEGIRGKSANLNDLIERLNYDPNKKFGNLSSGNKQKLGLILALMHQPKLLIMDEPTVGLDPLLQNEIYKIIDELKKDGATIFISSHNLPEVERVCDRVGIIRNGKIVELGAISQLSGKNLNVVRVSIKGNYSASDYEISGVDSVRDVGGGLEITVSGDIRNVLKKLSSENISSLEISKASLEEIFLKFYERESNND